MLEQPSAFVAYNLAIWDSTFCFVYITDTRGLCGGGGQTLSGLEITIDHLVSNRMWESYCQIAGDLSVFFVRSGFPITINGRPDLDKIFWTCQ